MDEFDAYDVVKELRDAQDSSLWQRDSYKYMCKVAADEIEKLREALYDIQDMPDNWEQDEELNLLFVVDNHVRIAKAALGDE
jgi:hypothetical protein